ncbi:MAG TPA: SpoIIE family protein phosphatase [Acidobacteriaceae bacterium]|nr:SpoIIE family protein phosphatase [Acidobacteriaceae bacterium]
MRSVNERVRGLLNRPFIHKKKRGFAFWSLVTALVLFLLRLVPGIGQHISLSPWIALLVGIVASLPAFFRWVRWRLLWKLRNRLFVTYALIGLTPVVLFGLLAAFAAYVLFGQFANFAATSEIHSELVALAANTDALALHMQQELIQERPPTSAAKAPQLPPAVPPEAKNIMSIPGLEVGVYLDGKLQKLDLPSAHAITTVSTPPAWVHGSFNGLILSGHQVYFAAVTREPVGPHTLFVITGLRLDPQFLGRVVSGLGTMTMWPNVHLQTSLPIADQHPEYSASADSNSKPNANATVDDDAGLGPMVENESRDAGEITGGVLPKREDMFDLPINFPTTLDTREWSTGKPTTVFALVTSRPSALYQRLFQQSLLIGGGVRTALILTAIVFAFLELLAIVLASRLSRTITRSVSDLYHATREVDQGRLDYRIPVKRQDQLAALSRSFNTMSESLVRLLEEQKEKERMEGELEIAQEVQSNLFPSCDVRLGELELHGLCRPARTVSGDYYDFLVLGHHSLCMAMGDISGKGISAALLMAGLHSAVRAFSLGGNEILSETQSESKHPARSNGAAEEIFVSPANLMRLLNLHLYRSTQPEKYATLFLANYEVETRTVRYSNGGQLPPLVLRPDGSVVRLDRGGTVVGLLDDMQYEEGALTLRSGDIIIAYSDGVTEPENEFGDFGEERMVELVHRNRHLPLEEISGALMQALKDWIGGEEQPDDITIVLARQS